MAILYGDWGTSKAYVVGLAFALAGYSSFWLIAAMSVLTALVGINYITICRHYPDGGGVYGSVRHRSEIISIDGAFLLIADYIVTAAISALSAFEYLGVPHPERFAGGAIAIIGALNYFGPRHTGTLAFLITIPVAIVVGLLGLLSLPHLGTAIHNIQPFQGGMGSAWLGFAGIVLALSGVEAVANSTGVMKLNPGSSDAKPVVTNVSTRAILIVMVEVCVFTTLLGLAMHALPGLEISPAAAGGHTGSQVNAPGNEGVRDYMLRYMGEVFAGQMFGQTVGWVFGFVVSLVLGLLLLSAVNTSIGALIGIQFLLSRDGEIPRGMQKLNSFGVPVLPIMLAAVVPFLLVLFVRDMSGLADLYAVGVVGAIAVNLGSTATDFKLTLKKWERGLMFFTFAVMLAIEITLVIEKPNARVFVASILAVGLVLRGVAKEWEQKRRPLAVPEPAPMPAMASTPPGVEEPTGQPMLCAVRGIGRTLDFALAEAKETNRPLYLLFIREQKVLTEQDYQRKWPQDAEASKIFTYAGEAGQKQVVRFCYAVSDSPADTIVDIAATLGVSRVILGSPKRGTLINMLRGNIITQVSEILPEEIHLLVHA
jgi:amino acid transporter/nucleotide-binding universal stress UspA family protein